MYFTASGQYTREHNLLLPLLPKSGKITSSEPLELFRVTCNIYARVNLGHELYWRGAVTPHLRQWKKLTGLKRLTKNDELAPGSKEWELICDAVIAQAWSSCMLAALPPLVPLIRGLHELSAIPETTQLLSTSLDAALGYVGAKNILDAASYTDDLPYDVVSSMYYAIPDIQNIKLPGAVYAVAILEDLRGSVKETRFSVLCEEYLKTA